MSTTYDPSFHAVWSGPAGTLILDGTLRNRLRPKGHAYVLEHPAGEAFSSLVLCLLIPFKSRGPACVVDNFPHCGDY